MRHTPSSVTTFLGNFYLGLGATCGLCVVASVEAATFLVSAGDEPGLIASINAANANGEADTIVLPQSNYEFFAPDNFVDGPNALPSVTTPITIEGNGATVSRAAGARSLLRLFHVASDGELVINDLSVEGGDLFVPNPSGAASHGGGIYSRGHLTLNRSALRDNSANVGGAVLVNGGRIDVDDSAFVGNRASSPIHPLAGGPGGALAVLQSMGRVSGSTFVANQAHTGGGAMLLGLSGGFLFQIEGSSFLSNSAPEFFGGAISIVGDDGSQATIDRSRFVGNTAFKYGAVSSCGGSTRMRDSSFTSNSSGSVAIECTSGGAMHVENSTFAGNQVSGSPGTGTDAAGLTNAGGDVSVVNSTFSDNLGTAIANNTHSEGPGSMSLLHVTVTGGIGPGSAGGLINHPNGTLDIANTIIANSTIGLDCLNLGTIGTNAGNLVEDGSCSSGLSGDPKLDTLEDNGGPTETHALFAGSPALDVANGGLCAPNDQRGVARPVGRGCDIGAYEGSKVPIERIRIDYLTRPQPYLVVCDRLRQETIVVAMLGSAVFDVRTAVPESVSLGGAAPGIGQLVRANPYRDVNGDRQLDVLMEWPLRAAYRDLACPSVTALRLVGVTRDRVQFHAGVAVAPGRDY